MKRLISLVLLAGFLAATVIGCGASPSATDIPESPAATAAAPTATAIGASSTPAPEGRAIVVTSTADSGPGTLRQALLEAMSGDIITFDPEVFPPHRPATILLKAEDDDSALPNITQGGVTVDASDAGVILDGSDIEGEWVNGLEIYSDGNTVRGLQIVNFTGSGIALCGGSHNTIGGERSIGAGPLGQGNLSSKNGIGIDLCTQGSYNTVAGNIVSSDPTGSAEWGNEQDGICIENGMAHNTIGPDNIIAHNGSNGIRITGSGAFGNTITQNSIHDNGWVGIELEGGGNTEPAAPMIFDFDLSSGTVAGTASGNCTVEIFSDSGDEGEIYEGQTTADGAGVFSFNKGAPFTGPHLTATATDGEGNSSRFSMPTSGTAGAVILQEGNDLPRIRLQPKQSGELEENRIGVHFSNLWHLEPEVFPHSELDASTILELGLKRVRFAINDLDAPKVDWTKPEFSIDPSHDEFITDLADNGVAITYVLSFWDIEYRAGGGEATYPRFETEEEIERYLDYVRFIVRHFEDRIECYEMWNEPTITDTVQWIEVEDYINLVRRAVPVIRQEYPEAKIVVGGTDYLIFPPSREYLFSILRSDTMSLVDAVSWHPMYGTSPEYDFHRQYYYEYASIVQEIKDVASAQGFRGEYVADELIWRTPDQADPTAGWPDTYSETVCAKYYTRGIVMHLGMDVAVSQILLWGKPQWFHTIQNLSTSMAGAQPTSIPIEIQSEATNIRSYGFSLPSGDKLIALWTDGVAVEDDPGVPATVVLPGFSDQRVTGIDVLQGVQQEMITNREDGNLVIRDLLVKDYPTILRVGA